MAGGVKEVEGHFRSWLRTLTGCLFATAMARTKGGLAIYAMLDPRPAAAYDALLDLEAEQERAVAFVLPWINDEAALVDLLETLASQSPRWALRPRNKPGVRDAIYLGIDWTTPAGLVSHVMGFAPLLTMPVTRRAPYVAIAAWPGGRSNPRWTPKAPSRVSFVDAAHGVSDDKYDGLWQDTQAGVARILSQPADDAARYRNVAFVLSATYRDRFTDV